MAKSYRLLKTKHPTHSAIPPKLNNVESDLHPRLVIAARFSATRNGEDLIDRLPPAAAPLEARGRRAIAAADRQPPTIVDRAPLAALSQPAPASEVGWRSVLLLLILTIAATGGIYAARQRLNAPVAPLTAAQQSAALLSTAFIGTVKPISEVKIAAPISAVVKNIFARIGDRVKEGQPLLTLDDREAQAAVAQARLEKELAGQQVSQLKINIANLNQHIAALRAELANAGGRVSVAQRRAEQVPIHQRQDSPERAQAIYDQALARYQRAEDLHRRGLVSEQEFEETRSALRIAEVDLKNSREAANAAANLETAQESQSKLQSELAANEQQQQLTDLNAQLQNALLHLEQATQKLAIAEQQLAETTIKATRDGTIVELPIKIGDQLVVGTMLARLAQMDRLAVEVPVSASLINALRLGNRAVVMLPTAAPARLEGQVTTINPLPAANLNHIVEVEFENRASAILVGQSAEIHFLAE